MTKQKRVELVMNAIKQSGYSFKVLDEKNDVPVHVRIDLNGTNFDVWPATGTYGANGKFIKNDANGFIRSLGVDAVKLAKTNSQRITDLEEYCAFLEHEISLIKDRI